MDPAFASRHPPHLTMALCVGVLLLLGVGACGSDERPTDPSSPTNEVSATSTIQISPASPSISTHSDSTPIAIDDAIWKRVRTEGHVMVIVTLNVPFRPEAELNGQAAIEEQRAAIAKAQDDLVASLTEGHTDVVTRLSLLPQIVLNVDEPALRQLVSSPLVLAVQENSLSAPTTTGPLTHGGRL